MSKTRTTVTIDTDVWKAVKVRAARTGQRDSEIVEAALRSNLGFDLLEEIWATADLSEDEAMELALEAQRAVRGQGS